jgi:hypothetical protein
LDTNAAIPVDEDFINVVVQLDSVRDVGVDDTRVRENLDLLVDAIR